jgi:transposase
MQLPPDSPDLNPIEDVWSMLKRGTSARFDEEPPGNVEDLVRMTPEEWEKLHWGKVFEMIDGCLGE